VLERFDNKVKPTSMFKLGILTEEDVKDVMAAQGRCLKIFTRQRMR
jgi:hypothetical protein